MGSRIAAIAKRLKEQQCDKDNTSNRVDHLSGNEFGEGYLVARNREIRELFLTGKWTQTALGKKFDLSQGQIRYLLINALSYEPDGTLVVDRSILEHASKTVQREGWVKLEELLEDYDSYTSGKKSQAEIASSRGITQGAISWRLRHPLLDGKRPPLPPDSKFRKSYSSKLSRLSRLMKRR